LKVTGDGAVIFRDGADRYRRQPHQEEQIMSEKDMTTVVVGAGRGLGRGIAQAFAAAGAPVVAVARTTADVGELAATTPRITAVVADAAEEGAAEKILAEHAPSVLVLVAGAIPVNRPLHEHTWETFSVNWNADVRIAFGWLRAALRQPLRPGSRVIVVSSGAALRGSPASGGYAGAKATQRFIASYAQEESDRAGLGLTVTAVLPSMTPLGNVGKLGAEAYSARTGQSYESYVAQLGDLLTPEIAGQALVGLAQSEPAAAAYLLSAAGLRDLT
jgi:NAD(P)-dependent dehydrogenase (short-subunit alcohol dehydrogenase family)